MGRFRRGRGGFRKPPSTFSLQGKGAKDYVVVDHLAGIDRMSWGQFYDKELKPSVEGMLTRFNQAKAAAGFVGRTMVQSGCIDLNRLSSFRTSDYIFKNEFLRRKCKNHGVFVILDISSSMLQEAKIQNTMLQAIKLAFFCRRAKIPFEVVGFTSKQGEWGTDNQADVDDVNRQLAEGYTEFASNPNAIRLVQFLHSNIGTEEKFVSSCKTLIRAAAAHSSSLGRGLSMGGTPLLNALDVLTPYIEEFKLRQRIENLNVMVLTDGEAEPFHKFHKNHANSEPSEKFTEGKMDISRYSFAAVNPTVLYRSQKDGLEFKVPPNIVNEGGDKRLGMMFAFMRSRLKCKLFWIFVVSRLNGYGAAKAAERFGNASDMNSEQLAKLKEESTKHFDANGFVALKGLMQTTEMFLIGATVKIEHTPAPKNQSVKEIAKYEAKILQQSTKAARATEALSRTIGDAIARDELSGIAQ